MSILFDSFETDFRRKTQGDFRGVVNRCGNQVATASNAIRTGDTEMGVGNSLLPVPGDVPLEREELGGFVDPRRYILRPVPIPDRRIPYHANPGKDHGALHSQLAERVDEVLAVRQPKEPILSSDCVDHRGQRVPPSSAAAQLLSPARLRILIAMDATGIVRWTHEKLRERYGAAPPALHPPIENLVLTILSQNTNDVNRDRAYGALMNRFGSMEAVRDAPVDEIAAAIRIGGLHRQKAARIRQVLKRITAERGALDIAFLAELPLDEAMAWLLASPGVGHKTAGIVMLFSFGKPYFPVDTHIRRVFTRLGVIGPKEDPHRRMNDVLPSDSDLLTTLHLSAIQLGRELCHPRGPKCEDCPLQAPCTWFAAHVAEAPSARSSGGQ